MQPQVLLDNYKKVAKAGFDARIHFIDVMKQKEHMVSKKEREEARHQWDREEMEKKLIYIGDHLAHFSVCSHKVLLGNESKAAGVLYMEPRVKIFAAELKIYCDLAAKMLGPGNAFLKARLPKRM